MSQKIEITEEQLIDLHAKQKKTQTEIAKIFKCNRRTIRNRLKHFGIPINPRLDLPIEELIHLYTKENFTTQHIADIFKCNRGCVESRLRKHCIKTTNYQRKYMQYYNQKLTEYQREIIKGSLLGDGSVFQASSGRKNCRFGELHGKPQLPYLKWKMNKISNFVVRQEPEEVEPTEDSFSDELKYRFSTIHHTDFNPYREFFYPEGRKVVKKFKLTPLSLAIWYFDDGDIKRKTKHIRLHTEGFDDNSVDTLSSMLFDDYKIDNKIEIRRWKWKGVEHEGKIISLNKCNSLKLLEIVRNFVIPSVDYKLGHL